MKETPDCEAEPKTQYNLKKKVRTGFYLIKISEVIKKIEDFFQNQFSPFGDKTGTPLS